MRGTVGVTRSCDFAILIILPPARISIPVEAQILLHMKLVLGRKEKLLFIQIGHAILDSLQPNWLNIPTTQTRALHESFGDITALFFVLSELGNLDKLLVQSKCDLSYETFISRLAEQFGEAVTGSPHLRTFCNHFKMDEVEDEEHELSQVLFAFDPINSGRSFRVSYMMSWKIYLPML